MSEGLSGWRKCLLGEIITLQRGFDITQNKQEAGNYPVVSSSGVKSWHKEWKVAGPGVVIGRKGTLGTVFYLPDCFWPHDTTLWVKNFHGNFPRFIYYFLNEFEFARYDVGSSNPTLNRNHVHLVPAYLAPFPEQKAIANVLSSLDGKIDLLHRQNKTLESMAETLFRHWFIEEAQEDWKISTVGKQLKTVLGGTPSTTNPEYWGGSIPWINSGEVNKFRIIEATKFITELGLRKSNTTLLPKGSTVVAITGTTLGQVSLLEIETCANQSVVGLIPNDKLPKEYVFLLIKSKIKEIILSETGGAQPHINKNDINDTEIVIPPENILSEKTLVFKNFFEKITTNVFQIQTLEKLRDTLLPKLMSGEVRVEV